ncbi:MAG: cytochrome c oxidase accessory protein CcoG [Polyangiales bacterium]
MSDLLPLYEQKSSLRADGSRDYVHPADVRGRFTTVRRWLFPLLIAVYVALPLVEIGGHPAVFLDIAARRFYLFGLVFNAQDAWLLFFLLTGIGFSLILLTTLLGRIWCGYGCPQTVFLEGVFRRIERAIEGPRAERLRRNKGPWTVDKAWRKAIKHVIFFALSAAVAHIFLSYFVSVPRLLQMLRTEPWAHPTAFGWVAVVTGLTYFNFAWFREQVCLIICPYGRLQSALTDADSLVIGYDQKRGEPRGHIRQQMEGDCIDCNRCVAVCPTGIDIRNGLQVDCIGCAACVDACDDVMRRVGKAPGLVRYDSLNGLDGKKKRILRPRLWLYAVLGALGLTAASVALSQRHSFEANLLRATSVPYVISDGRVQNSLEVHVVNKDSDTRRFRLSAPQRGKLRYVFPVPEVELKALTSRKVPVLVWRPDRGKPAGEAQIRIDVTPIDAPEQQRQMQMSFVAPGR